MPSLLAILGLDRSAFSAGLDRAREEARSKGQDIGSALGNKIAAGLGAAAIVAAAKKEFDIIKELAARSREIDIGAARLNTGTQGFQDLEHAAKKGGASIDALYSAYRKLVVNAAEALSGQKEMVAYFAQLGVSISDLRNKIPDEIFRQIAAGMQGAAVDGEKLTAIIKTMGRSADELLPAMRGGLFGEKNPFKIPDDELASLRSLKKDLDLLYHAADRFKGYAAIAVGLGPIINIAQGLAGMIRHFKGIKDEQPVPTGLNDAATMEAAAASEASDARKEALKEEAHQRERLVHLIERQRELEKVFREGGLNDTQKLALVEARRNELLKQSFSMTSAQGQADNQNRNNEITEANIEIQRMLKAEEASLRRTHPEVNALQRAGAYAGPADRNYTLMQMIEKHVAKIASTPHSEKRLTIGGF